MVKGSERRNAEDVERLVRRLHAEHGAALYAWALRRFDNSQDAEEVVSEALVKAWRHYDQYDSAKGSERSWVFAIARNAAIDQHRRSVRHLRLVSGNPIPEIIDDDSGVERVAEKTVIGDALMQLADHHREVIVDAFFVGLTVKQIAERLGIPPGTVKSRMYYGMRTLRTALEEREILQ